MTESSLKAEAALSSDLRQDIEDMLLDYCHRLDDEDWDAWPGFFTEDGRYKILTRENFDADLPLGIMYCDGVGMMKDRMLALQTANIFEPHTHCHLLSRPALSGAGSQIEARTNFMVTRTMQNGAMEIFATGKYLDQIDLSSSTPKFRERIVVIESRRIDILLVAPL